MAGEERGPAACRIVEAEVRDVLDAYAGGISDLLEDRLVGVYLYGSVANGDYRPGVSDVDLVVLHRSDLREGERRNLTELHERMGRHEGADRLDASFVPLRLVGTDGDESLPFFRDGRFHRSGCGDLNAVTWRSLREHGFALRGPPPAKVVPPVSDGDLFENMRRNLDFLSQRMPAHVASGTEDVVFGVLSACRVLYTLRIGGLTGKRISGETK